MILNVNAARSGLSLVIGFTGHEVAWLDEVPEVGLKWNFRTIEIHRAWHDDEDLDRIAKMTYTGAKLKRAMHAKIVIGGIAEGYGFRGPKTNHENTSVFHRDRVIITPK